MKYTDSQIEVALRALEQNHTPCVIEDARQHRVYTEVVWKSIYLDPPGYNWLRKEYETYFEAYEAYLSYFKKGNGQGPQSDQT